MESEVLFFLDIYKWLYTWCEVFYTNESMYLLFAKVPILELILFAQTCFYDEYLSASTSSSELIYELSELLLDLTGDITN